MRLILVIFLFVMHFLLVTAMGQPASCPSFTRYRGNEIRLHVDSRYAEVTAWFTPVDLDWATFRAQCFDPDPSYWYSGLLNRVTGMFALSQAQLLGYGASDSSRQVYVAVGFYFSWSSYYSEDDGVLKFRDVFKPGGGYFDEVHVYSDKPVYGWEPTPTRYTSQEAHWLNPSYSAAPSWYIVYLWPVPKVTVRVEGLPSSYSVQLSIDGKPVGYVRGGNSQVFRVSGANVSVGVQPVVDVDEKTRYRVDRDTISASAGGEAVFRYYREFLVRTDTSPSGVEITVGGASCRTPCSTWVREGDTLSVTVPERALESSLSTTRTYYAFTGWSDGSSERSRYITIQTPLSITASYTRVTEHYVSVVASPPEASRGVSGSGWYREGSVATLRANETIQVSDYERLRFLGWSTGETSGLITKAVNSPLSIEARYEREYRVEVRSDFGVVFGSGWYRSGDEARVGLEGLKDGYYYSPDGKARYRFQGWRVLRSSIQPPSTPILALKVDGPVILQAEFGSPEYYVCVDGNCEFLSEGSAISPREDEPILGGLMRKVFEGYLDPFGRNLGRSPAVNGPMVLSSAYRTEVNWPLTVAVALIVAVSFLAVPLSKRRSKTSESTVERKKEEKIEELTKEIESLEEELKKKFTGKE
ncbi:hypothetical protein [Infirmifilum sp. NZ]|uniref:hypothetical protein n=1 Tax=Infirmifilum sp. NZ TaxID=2926850 RepID=UPI0027A57460|nr:hypothetical protein [Infirmifilum sp. NZ]UNQ73386.1 hypothetical protein MOV14_09780 [Infirmifilum sp. NZ]